MKTYDVVIIGGGPAGLAAAISLHELGIKRMVIFERNAFLGGILLQCIHTGFGLTYFKKNLTGPEYAAELIRKLSNLGIEFHLNANVTNITPEKIVTVASKTAGFVPVKAKTIIIATGCRERTRENLEVAGTRPAGIFTAGQAQALINLHHFKIGKNVIIQGSGDIGLIMARRLTIEGYNVINVFERQPHVSGLIRNKIQCLDDFGIPLTLSSQIQEIHGAHRVEGVTVAQGSSTTFYPCDTILFSVGLIPEIEVAKKAGASSSNQFNLDVNNKFETTTNGLFACGNALHIHDLADHASREGEKVAHNVFQQLTSPSDFRAEKNKQIPYHDPEKNAQYNQAFFDTLKEHQQIFCTTCPKGCLLSENNYPCPKGKNFFEASKEGKQQPLTTTVYATINHQKRPVPVRSEEPIPIDEIPSIKEKLRLVKSITKNYFYVKHKEKKIKFFTENLC